MDKTDDMGGASAHSEENRSKLFTCLWRQMSVKTNDKKDLNFMRNDNAAACLAGLFNRGH